jgi:hypothetical protein
VYGFNFRADDKNLPGRDSGRGGYSFEQNQFDHDDPYHKMIPLVEAGGLKICRIGVTSNDGWIRRAASSLGAVGFESESPPIS